MQIRSWFQRHHLQILLSIGLTLVSLTVMVGISISQSIVVITERTMEQSWRTTYDILVRPSGSRSPIEEKYGLIAENHLSGIRGGITFDQYEQIHSLPGVDIIAPIAMIGYIDWLGETRGFSLSEAGVYLLETTFRANDGITPVRVEEKAYYFISPNDETTVIYEEGFPPLYVNPYFEQSNGQVATLFQTGLLVAGIEPSEESKLIGLDQTVIDGVYLMDNMPLHPVSYSGVYSYCPDRCPEVEIALPMLISNMTYIDMIMHSTLYRLPLGPGVDSLENLIALGGLDYLAGRPGEAVGNEITDSAWVHQNTVEKLKTSVTSGTSLYGLPTSLEYREFPHPFKGDQLALEIVVPDIDRTNESCPTCLLTLYRLLAVGNNFEERWESVQLQAAYRTNYVGIFDIERIPKPVDVNRAPLETYFPPVSILLYDEQGTRLSLPKELHPTDNQAGYIQSPPLILTTLEAARAMRGDSAISAIRVRVALDECPPDQPESCTLTDAAQRKIEAIAIEIQRQTGLDVDIMVGSSPTRVLVHVPEIGYVEEQWIQKGVNLVYKRGIQTGNWLLLGTLLLAGSLFTLDMAWAEVLSRRRVIALQKALGWRSRTVFTQILGQVVGIGVLATAFGTMIALALIRWLGWEPIPQNLLIVLPLLVIGLCFIGSLLPAWSASRVPPILELQRGGVQYQSHKHTIVFALWSYAWSEIKRRRVRSMLTGMGSTLSAALLTLLLGVTLQQRGMLGGTLLGEFILVNIEGYHYAIVGIGLGLAFLSTFNGLLGSILERQREIGVLKAIGWRTVSVARLFILQGTLLGVIGGGVGALAGALAFLYFYQSASTGLALAFLLGIGAPALVGALAASYPAWLAASVPPAEAVRYE